MANRVDSASRHAFCFREIIGGNTRDSFLRRNISVKKLAGKQKMVYVESV